MPPITPGEFVTTYKKAQELMSTGRTAEAREIYTELAAAAPGRYEVFFQLAGIGLMEGDEDFSLANLREAYRLKPDSPEVVLSLVDILVSRSETDEVIALMDALIATAPGKARFRVEKAAKLQRLGDFAAAEEELLRAMKLDPRRGEPYRMITQGRKIKPGDPLIGKMRKVLRDPKTDTFARVQIGFALAKAMEDTKQYDKVFRYLNPANAAVKKASNYKVSQRRAEVDALIAVFRGHDFTPPPAAPDAFSPIFVTGLPRSGTTLVERIFASHSQVVAGGEMKHAARQCYKTIGSPSRGFRSMADVTAEELAALGRDYEAAVRHSVAFDRFVTDKAMQSFLMIGLLKQAIPGARFVVVRRDPRDGLYSIYKNMFAKGTHGYAYDFEDLAAYYATFLKILDFWREALPGGFHEVHYEDLVADPEPQTRALVAAAGLEWEDACLNSHEAEGSVKTLSMQQVRQPIYKTSAAAWRRYEKDLAPLVAALEREGVVLDGPE